VQILLLVALASLAHGARLTTLSIRGEEPRRAGLAREMIAHGDWIVPRLQGEPFLTRPPMQAWAIAAASLLTGDVNAAAARLPSVVGVVLATVVVFVYARRFLSGLGAWTAALAFTSMAQVLELARLGETEGFLAFWVACSLLGWHWGYARCRPEVAWPVGYVMAALGALTKGLPPVGFFAAAAALHLAWNRNWRFALNVGHAVGIVMFAGIVGAWQIPFALRLGVQSLPGVWWQEIAIRFASTPAEIAAHLLLFPLEVLSCMLPWSPLLLCFADRRLREADDGAGDSVRFMTAAGLAGFVVCWLVPGAHERYLMPLYPAAGVLVGVVAQRLQGGLHGQVGDRLAVLLTWSMAATMAVCGSAIVVASTSLIHSFWRQPPWFAIGYAVSCAAAAVLIVRGLDERRWLRGVTTVAIFMILSHTGVYITQLEQRSAPVAAEVAAVAATVSPGIRLVSLGPAQPLFAFLWPDPIERVELDELCQPGAYFCVTRDRELPEIPVPWRMVAELTIARHRDVPIQSVVIGECRQLDSGDDSSVSSEPIDQPDRLR
jgi:4-amino-4-deoxy-L-arabinose transferase-like glycosyltransferase